MRTSNIVILTAAVLLTSLQLGALGAIFSGSAAQANTGPQYRDAKTLLAEVTLPPVVVLAAPTD